MDFDAFNMRDAVLAAIGLVGIYLAVMVLRLSRLRRRRQAPSVDEAPLAPPTFALEAEEESGGDDLVYAPPPLQRAAPPVHDFNAELARSQQESEIRQLREEVVQLRQDVGQLRAELADLSAARLVSPQYSDAMALAQRGLGPQDVADRCGISLGEAELVWALSRGPKNFDQEEEYGGEPGVERAA